MITIEQIKAARGLLEWNQEQLAKAAQLSLPAINNIERRITTPRVETMEAIQRSFEEAGVEFTEGPGVRLQGETLRVQVWEGKDSLFRLFNDIFEYFKEDGGEYLLSGADEAIYMEIGGDRFLAMMKKFEKYGITKKILIREEDRNFVDPKHYYRWVPDAVFSHIPYYVYGNKYAMVLWKPVTRIILIENAAIADNYRHLFTQHWESAKIPD